MTIQSAAEMDAWLEAFRDSPRLEPTPEEWSRVLEGYRRLLNVAEAAKRAMPHVHGQSEWLDLRKALDALVEEPKP